MVTTKEEQLDGGADAGAANAGGATPSDAPTPPPPSPQHSGGVAPRVLTVGDGNFSYSLALARHEAVALTATSFDTFDELVAKYPEAERICSQLKALGACVAHGVDATNLRATLRSSSTFDRVVFNHPHCGEENVRRHQSLLSHFFVSALEVLASGGGRVHLTLAEGQPERWEAVVRAEKAGLQLLQQVDDVDAHDAYGLEYDRKRHQNGKSFHQVTLHGEKKRQRSTLFIFARAGDCLGDKASSDVMSKRVDTVSKPSERRSKKRKAEQQRPGGEGGADSTAQLVCSQCDKSFKSPQGLKTHVHMVHELQTAGQTVAGAKPLRCEFCDREFTNADAQRQHTVAKHGKDRLIQPDWYVKQQPPVQPSTSDKDDSDKGSQPTAAVSLQSMDKHDGKPEEPQTCTICQLKFATKQEFDCHWQNLQPSAAAELECSTCGRSFGEERALRQHQNFCSAAEQLTK